MTPIYNLTYVGMAGIAVLMECNSISTTIISVSKTHNATLLIFNIMLVTYDGIYLLPGDMSIRLYRSRTAQCSPSLQ